MEEIITAPAVAVKVKKKKRPAKAKKPAKSKPKKKAVKAKVKNPASVVRSERLDMRLSKAEKAKVAAVAKRKKITITAVILDAISRLR